MRRTIVSGAWGVKETGRATLARTVRRMRAGYVPASRRRLEIALAILPCQENRPPQSAEAVNTIAGREDLSSAIASKARLR